MNLLNVEIKARCRNPEQIRRTLQDHGARFVGVDHQIDTYFHCQNGRLKLREGNIEHHLIFYQRDNQAEPKSSQVILYNPQPDNSLKAILNRALGILVTVDKKREIYFIDNVKFHLDRVEHLGTFVEIEAIDSSGDRGEAQLHQQCQQFMRLLNIQSSDLIATSYSDMLLAMKNPTTEK